MFVCKLRPLKYHDFVIVLSETLDFQPALDLYNVYDHEQTSLLFACNWSLRTKRVSLRSRVLFIRPSVVKMRGFVSALRVGLTGGTAHNFCA